MPSPAGFPGSPVPRGDHFGRCRTCHRPPEAQHRRPAHRPNAEGGRIPWRATRKPDGRLRAGRRGNRIVAVGLVHHHHHRCCLPRRIRHACAATTADRRRGRRDRRRHPFLRRRCRCLHRPAADSAGPRRPCRTVGRPSDASNEVGRPSELIRPFFGGGTVERRDPDSRRPADRPAASSAGETRPRPCAAATESGPRPCWPRHRPD